MDSALPLGSSTVFCQSPWDPSAPRLLVEASPKFSLTLAPTDAVLPVRLSWLTRVSTSTAGGGGQPAWVRSEGLGCAVAAAGSGLGGCQTDPSTTTIVTCPVGGGVATVNVTLSSITPTAVVMLTVGQGAGGPFAVVVNTCAGAPASVGNASATGVGVFAAFPSAQAYGAASVATGSLAFSLSRFDWSNSSGVYTARGCGEVVVPASSASPLYIAVARTNAALPWPTTFFNSGGSVGALPTVTLTISCAASAPNPETLVIVPAAGQVVDPYFSGMMYQQVLLPPVAGLVAGQRAYTSPSDTFNTVYTVAFTGAAGGGVSGEYRMNILLIL